MKNVSKGMLKPMASSTVTAIVMAGVAATTVQAKEWQAIAGGESRDRGSQALAFLPNQLWVHTGDSIRWTFPTHERDTLTLLKPGQTRPPGFGPIFDVLVGCPGLSLYGGQYGREILLEAKCKANDRSNSGLFGGLDPGAHLLYIFAS